MVNIEDVDNLPVTVKRNNDWAAILVYLHVHVFSLIALVALKDTYISTILFGLMLVGLSVLGTTAGAHRLWTHRTYKGDIKLRIFLMICQTLVGEGTIYDWVLEHRLHHKYFGTSLDCFNVNKGFLRVHVLNKGSKFATNLEKLKSDVDMSDIESDSVVMFQKKYYWFLFVIITLLLPINAPAEYWGESLYNAALVAGMLRMAIALNVSWLVGSGIKIWSLKTGQVTLNDQNLLELIEKQDWLPYHYIAPWDYRTSEYGGYSNDLTSVFIRVCGALGMASSLKTMDGPTIGKAIQISAETNKPISECLLEVQGFETINSRFNM